MAKPDLSLVKPDQRDHVELSFKAERGSELFAQVRKLIEDTEGAEFVAARFEPPRHAENGGSGR